MPESRPEGASPDTAHERTVVVWDVPTAIGRGQPFSIMAAVRCAARCVPGPWRLEVHDERGRPVGSTGLAAEPLAGTEALYHARLELHAPESDGLFEWAVVAPADCSAEIRHDAVTASFGLRVVPPADYTLTVIAIAKDRQAPLAGAKVVVHPYRAVTDARGIAELVLPRGPFRLFVTGPDLYPYRHDGELDADTTIRAELEPDPGPSDAEVWS